jgi:selenocysteine lyase/cysteine desulfurase
MSFVGAAEAMKMLLGVGTDKVKTRIMKLTDHVIDSAKDLGLELQTPEEKSCRSGIVNFRTSKPLKLVERLGRKKIIVSARAQGIRVSPHYYNSEEEIDKLMEEVRKAEA